MAQRIVELLIGRLLTDEQFRTEFLADPERLLGDLCGRGFELTPVEVAALASTDRSLWIEAAERLDPRLQKVSLLTPSTAQETEVSNV